jgi:hypothetical protein
VDDFLECFVVRLGECQLRRVNILSLDLHGKSSRTWIIARRMREETNTGLGGQVRRKDTWMD